MFNFLRRPQIARIANDQLYEAQLALLQHEAAAEHHEALAMMYRTRVERLTASDEPLILGSKA